MLLSLFLSQLMLKWSTSCLQVGIMHTGIQPWKHSSSEPLHVDCEPVYSHTLYCFSLLNSFPIDVHIALLLGVSQNLLSRAILSLPDTPVLVLEDRIAAIEAVGKVIWMQNDLVSRHYVRSVEEFKSTGRS